jgi:cytochrome c oxidase subunit 2
MKQIRHFVGTAIIVAALTVGIGLWLRQVIARMPLGASRQAVGMVNLLELHFWAIAFLFSLIVGIMLYSILFFRQKRGQMEDGDHIEGNTTLELLWTIIPLGVVVWFSFVGGQTLSDVELISTDAMRVNVSGRQWSWSFEYPETGITSSELVLPVDRQVLLRLRSSDVLHSFWVPEFGPKQDLLPGGLVRELRVTPTEEGEYKVRCAELCGKQHAQMLADVVVLSQAGFDAWVAETIAADPCLEGDQVGCGRKLSTEGGCLACHSLDGSDNIGPTWVGFFGSEHTHTDGSTAIVDADHIYDAIRNPAAQILTGRENVMPAAIGENLSDDDIAAITAFIESLK